MSRSADALVKPELLIWARKAAHIPPEYAAKSLDIPVEKLRAWESGESRPTVRQLRKMARKYRQPFAAFYLPEPPKMPQPIIRDYRRFPTTMPGELPLAVNFEIRLALDRREMALELLEEADESMPEFQVTGTLDDDPELLGTTVRNVLGVTYNEQSRLREPRVSFNYWRAIIESAGALVFQTSAVDLEFMRGFSIGEFPLPVVAVNRKDAYAARIFTMLHELAHIIIRTSSICDLDDRLDRPPEEQSTEVFCNRFAGACLVPGDQLRAEEIVLRSEGGQKWENEEIQQLSVRYGVSCEVILRRLLILGFTDADFYESKREELIQQFKSVPKKGGQRPSPAIDVVSTSGKPFVRLVLDAFAVGRITTSDVADYLGVRLKHLKKIEQIISVT
ncbi:MAG: hypothetical protein DDT33_00919 [Firmicutes bacterium]|nr:hypothetical protein [Bacillota bacterium]